MKEIQKIRCFIYTAWTFIGIHILWIISEKLFYGEIQHRIVDDIVSFPIMTIIYFMWKFKTERDNLKSKSCPICPEKI